MTDLTAYLNATQLTLPTIDLRYDPSITDPDDQSTYTVATVYTDSTNSKFFVTFNDFDWENPPPQSLSENKPIDNLDELVAALSALRPDFENYDFVDLDIESIDYQNFKPVNNYLINHPFDS